MPWRSKIGGNAMSVHRLCLILLAATSLAACQNNSETTNSAAGNGAVDTVDEGNGSGNNGNDK